MGRSLRFISSSYLVHGERAEHDLHPEPGAGEESASQGRQTAHHSSQLVTVHLCNIRSIIIQVKKAH